MIDLNCVSDFFECCYRAVFFHVDKVQGAIKRLCFYACTFVNPSENKEHKVFRKLQFLSTKSTLTDEERATFIRMLERINQLFNDDIIRRHSNRLNSPQNWENYQSLQGERKALVRLHELSEILSLKWECGKDFDDSDNGYFWHAHTQAIKIENLYMMVKAHEMGVALSLKALEYIRIVDELNLLSIIYVRDEIDVDRAIENLTKNHVNLPSIPEMEAFVQFMSKSAVLPHNEQHIQDMVWSRYFFTALYQKPHQYESKSYAKMILLFLCGIRRNRSLNFFSPQELLNKMEWLLSGLTEKEYITILHSFFDDMREMAGGRPPWYHVNQLHIRLQNL